MTQKEKAIEKAYWKAINYLKIRKTAWRIFEYKTYYKSDFVEKAIDIALKEQQKEEYEKKIKNIVPKGLRLRCDILEQENKEQQKEIDELKKKAKLWENNFRCLKSWNKKITTQENEVLKKENAKLKKEIDELKEVVEKGYSLDYLKWIEKAKLKRLK